MVLYRRPKDIRLLFKVKAVDFLFVELKIIFLGEIEEMRRRKLVATYSSLTGEIMNQFLIFFSQLNNPS